MAQESLDALEVALRDYVLTHVPLGIYDPSQTRRPRVEARSFEIELLEIDAENPSLAYAAGPVVLITPDGDVEQFLRVRVNLDGDGQIATDPDLRAAYIVETDSATGACKETAALANA